MVAVGSSCADRVIRMSAARVSSGPRANDQTRIIIQSQICLLSDVEKVSDDPLDCKRSCAIVYINFHLRPNCFATAALRAAAFASATGVKCKEDANKSAWLLDWPHRVVQQPCVALARPAEPFRAKTGEDQGRTRSPFRLVRTIRIREVATRRN